MLRRLLRVAGLGLVAVVAIAAIPVAGIELGCRGGAPAGPAALDDTRRPAIGEPGYARSQFSTYFTFPEWYIVYVAEDFAAFTASRPESRFAYLPAISGFWSSVCTIKRQTRGWAAPTADISTMIYVIGLSFTAEYAIKGAYESTIGRLTEWLRGPVPTAEDRFANRVAADYARFLYAVPWYKYPFWARLEEVWTTLPWSGPAPVRKAERRVALSLEYGVKAGYGRLIQALLDASGDDEAREIMMLVRGLTPDDLAAEPQLALLRRIEPDLALVRTPRYQVFTDVAVALALRGRTIVEVAGNRRILATALLEDGDPPPAGGGTEMISMPLAARPGWRRAGFDIAIDRLPDLVTSLERRGRSVEHLFDY